MTTDKFTHEKETDTGEERIVLDGIVVEQISGILWGSKPYITINGIDKRGHAREIEIAANKPATAEDIAPLFYTQAWSGSVPDDVSNEAISKGILPLMKKYARRTTVKLDAGKPGPVRGPQTVEEAVLLAQQLG